jgi:hypothetical protein
METQFAYGSNMDPAQLANKKIEMRNPRIAKIHGYQFGFTKKSDYDGKLKQRTRRNGKANISECEDSIVWGVLLELTMDEVEKMDQSEGLDDGHYHREPVDVVTDSGMVKAITYIACADKLIPNTAPLDWYLKHVLEGAKIQNLPLEYIMEIEKLALL